MNGFYSGPIIDPHHHLWDLSMQAHPWLMRSQQDEMVFGNISAIQRNYLPEDYLADVEGQNIVGTIHVEAGWDEKQLGQETIWLDSLERPCHVAQRYIARVPLLHHDALKLLAEQALHPRVVGIRDIVSWHPDPAKSFAVQDLMNHPQWRAGLATVSSLGLVFDLMLFPWQMADAERLVHDFPEIIFVINHCGSPADRSVEGMALWRHGLQRLSRAPNVQLKISDPVAYDPEWTIESLKEVIEYFIECFGPDRSMFASDFPVAGLHAKFSDLYTAFRTISYDFNPQEQSALFFDTANRIYNLNLNKADFSQG